MDGVSVKHETDDSVHPKEEAFEDKNPNKYEDPDKGGLSSDVKRTLASFKEHVRLRESDGGGSEDFVEAGDIKDVLSSDTPMYILPDDETPWNNLNSTNLQASAFLNRCLETSTSASSHENWEAPDQTLEQSSIPVEGSEISDPKSTEESKRGGFCAKNPNLPQKTCDICGKTFSKSVLSRHRKVHSNFRPYTCHICGKDFNVLYKLKLHIRTHTGEKPYACDFCGKAFVQSNHLVIHRRTHTGEKPYSCELCQKVFMCSAHLRIHAKVHSGSRQFSCKICSRLFPRHSKIDDHVRNVHPEVTPQTCVHCERSFYADVAFLAHMRSHRGNRPHICQLCGFSFSHFGSLKVHLKSAHQLPEAAGSDPVKMELFGSAAADGTESSRLEQPTEAVRGVPPVLKDEPLSDPLEDGTASDIKKEHDYASLLLTLDQSEVSDSVEPMLESEKLPVGTSKITIVTPVAVPERKGEFWPTQENPINQLLHVSLVQLEPISGVSSSSVNLATCVSNDALPSSSLVIASKSKPVIIRPRCIPLSVPQVVPVGRDSVSPPIVKTVPPIVNIVPSIVTIVPPTLKTGKPIVERVPPIVKMTPDSTLNRSSTNPRLLPQFEIPKRSYSKRRKITKDTLAVNSRPLEKVGCSENNSITSHETLHENSGMQLISAASATSSDNESAGMEPTPSSQSPNRSVPGKVPLPEPEEAESYEISPEIFELLTTQQPVTAESEDVIEMEEDVKPALPESPCPAFDSSSAFPVAPSPRESGNETREDALGFEPGTSLPPVIRRKQVFRCHICMRCFAHKASLNRHLRQTCSSKRRLLEMAASGHFLAEGLQEQDPLSLECLV